MILCPVLFLSPLFQLWAILSQAGSVLEKHLSSFTPSLHRVILETKPTNLRLQYRGNVSPARPLSLFLEQLHFLPCPLFCHLPFTLSTRFPSEKGVLQWGQSRGGRHRDALDPRRASSHQGAEQAPVPLAAWSGFLKLQSGAPVFHRFFFFLELSFRVNLQGALWIKWALNVIPPLSPWTCWEIETKSSG